MILDDTRHSDAARLAADGTSAPDPVQADVPSAAKREAAKRETTPSTNPFCTRRVRPGALPFIFPPGENAETLVRRLRENGWWGEIVGEHGAGKSALLAALVPAIHRAGRKTLLVELHDAQRRLPLDLDGQYRLNPFDLLIVDGYEQLGRWNRFRLKRLCRRRGWGLLVAVHASVGIPKIYRVVATGELAAEIVDRLMAGQSPPFDAAELAGCFARHRGNLRETLFDLYDLYEKRRPR